MTKTSRLFQPVMLAIVLFIGLVVWTLKREIKTMSSTTVITVEAKGHAAKQQWVTAINPYSQPEESLLAQETIAERQQLICGNLSDPRRTLSLYMLPGCPMKKPHVSIDRSTKTVDCTLYRAGRKLGKHRFSDSGVNS